MSEIDSEHADLVERVHWFFSDSYERADFLETEFKSLNQEVRMSAFGDNPPLTIDFIENMVSIGEISTIPNEEKFRALLQAVKITSTDIQLLHGSGSIMVFDEKGQMSRFFNRSTLLDQLKPDGTPVFPGGLWDYAINKAMIARVLELVGSDPTMMDPEDAEYISQIAGVPGAHMGSAYYETPNGRKYYAGGSGVEMTDDGRADMINKLPKSSTDEEYPEFTIAGIIDGLVAKWACQFVAGEVVTVEEAQREVDEIISKLPIFPKPYSDFHLVESILKKLPPHVH